MEATAYNIIKSSENCRDRFNSLGNGGKLFEPKNQITNDAVIQEARTVTSSLDFFLGIQDSNSQNNWQYISNNKLVSWFNWHSGEPENLNDDCVGPSGNLDYTWDDTTCGRLVASICEMTTEGILLITIVTHGLYFDDILFHSDF